MATDSIDKIYKIYDVLSAAGDKISEHEAEYLTLLEAVKGSDKEKRLAAQFISKFFKSFPNLIEKSIESQFDLCEDEDAMIRKHAVRDLPNFCKDHKEFTRKIADILTQLLQIDDAAELSVVHSSLNALFKIDAKGTFGGVFNQILSGEEIVRERSIRFLSARYKTLGPHIVTKDVEDYVIAEVKKVLQDVTADEFKLMMDILSETRLGKTVTGHQELVDLVVEQAELDQPFGGTEPENVYRLIACTRHALRYFSSQVDASKFITYMCEDVLPVLSGVPKTLPEAESDSHLELLKLTAELSKHCTTLETPENKLQHVFSVLLEYMPLPAEGDAEKLATEDPNLEFSYVECLLFVLHRLGKLHPDFLAANPDRMKDFRIRLQYFARATQGYMKKLKEMLSGKSQAQLKSEENAIKAVALKTTTNILALIKDLFHTPPIYKSNIILSWTSVAPKKDEGAFKRHAPITFDGNGAKMPRKSDEQARYQPPGGKYSERITSYSPRGARGFRGGRRGGNFRGRNRTWRNTY
ncbi:apoptosis inhibitor 5 [Neocloeon triangulifer]|uniref:apoptosis inhibitor 5 n=1 Tax=Neocloeon triangulifer TaxID=2078957 RepID=UPI00286F8828|nr:apoptosis inhibitor 5 [Neocloeon triangulifer]